MRYPLSYWKTGDLVALDLYHAKGMLMHSHSYDIVKHSAAVLYCINDGTTVYMHARYLREPKKNNET